MPSGTRDSSTFVVDVSREMTDRRMRTEMMSEAMGSARCQPQNRIMRVDTMTPALPSVSASTCKKMPVATARAAAAAAAAAAMRV